MISYDVAVLGAGASGLVCAHTAALGGCRVLLVDHADKAGRKLAVTGGGRCNFTNRNVTPGDYSGENPHFCRSALAGFTPEQSMALMQEAGIPFEEREQGQLFCLRPASEFVRFLVRRCEAAGCRFAYGEKVVAVEKQDGDAGFAIRTAASTYAARNVVVALGGPAWPQVGASGFGYELARRFGHRVTSIHPALVGFVMDQSWPLAGLQGLSLSVTIAVMPDHGDSIELGKTRAPSGRKRGHDLPEPLPLLFTHGGISGPASLQASLYWRRGMALHVDFLPSIRLDALLHAPENGKLLCRSLLKKHLPDRLAELLCPPQAADVKCASLSRALREALCAAVHAHIMRPVGTEGFTRAEVTAGGVSTQEVSSRTMQSERASGLYFCGEILDVTGRLGGYNLHWAFASGHAVGKALAAQVQ